MNRTTSIRQFEILDDQAKRQKSWMLVSLRDAIIAIASSILSAIFVLLVLDCNRGSCSSRDSSAIGRTDTVFEYNSSFVSSSANDDAARFHWESLVPVGRGTVEEPRGSHKFYTLSAIHQLHCLWAIQKELHSHTPERVRGQEHPKHRHSRHCIDYLRQSLMCAADLTLEPVDPRLGGVTGWGVERKCRDWEKLKAWAEDRRASNAKGFEDDE